MKTAADLVEISKRRLCYIYGYPLIENSFIQTNETVLAKAFMDTQRTGTTVLLHPGTTHLFINAVLYAIIASCLTYDFQIEEYADQFMKGDIVILNGRTRCEFIGIDHNTKYFTLMESNGTKTSIPLSGIHKIKLYEGDAKTLGTKGIRKTVREARGFLEKWFGSEYAYAARTQPYSVLVVCNKEEALEMVNTVTFSDKEKIFTFSELFPSAWFSATDSWDDFLGNSVRTRPVVMFTSRISIARDIIYNDQDKKIRSVIINGADNISSSPQELEDIMKRRAIHSTILLARTSYGVLPEFQIDDTPINLVYWSKQALLSLPEEETETFSKNPLEMLLNKLIDNEKDRETVFNLVLPSFKPELPQICRRALKQVYSLTKDEPEIKRFVISAFSLLRLYEQSCFPIVNYEELIKNGSISARLPSDELIILNEIYTSPSIEPEIKTSLSIIISALKDMHNALYEVNPKHEKLLALLADNNPKKPTKKAIVVPKDSYVIAVKVYINSELKQQIDVYSCGKFDNDALYESVIVSGVFDGKKFDPFRNNNAPLTAILGYPSEEVRFKWLKNEYNKVLEDYEARSILSYGKNATVHAFTHSVSDEIASILELEKQIIEMIPDTLPLSTSGSGFQTTAMLKAIRLVIFENDEWALFTEHYSPYVFDEKAGKIKDGDVEKLAEGDFLIFAVRDDITDFVDIIMDKLVPSTEPAFQEFYRMSRRWKTVLREYMRINHMSYVDIARKLEELGHPKHQVTIRSWLNEDSRIIGPRDEDAYIAIALVTEDNEMSRLSSTYCKACDEVRSMRIRILHYIENQIIKSYAGTKRKPQDQSLVSVIGDAKQYTRGLRIASITPVEREVPASFANRPHKLLL